MQLDIARLDAGRADDFITFFDHDAFEDNPDWAECYCQFYHYAADDPRWEQISGAENRGMARENILSGRTQGYLAYADGKVVGWCSAGPKMGYARLTSDERLRCADDAAVFSIVCYVVNAHFRRQGIARALLRHACLDARERGFTHVEVYPRLQAQSDASHYHGPQSLYISEGFEVHRELETVCVMRLRLV